jgi:hypothetical protein
VPPWTRTGSLAATTAIIEIDLCGERWIGCANCNRWGKPGDAKLVMEISEEDLTAVRERVKR